VNRLEEVTVGPFISRARKQVLEKMQEGFKAVVPHRRRDGGPMVLLHRIGDCDDCICAHRTVVLELAKKDFIRMNERDDRETDYIVAIDD
jgi:hypothetical protein